MLTVAFENTDETPREELNIFFWQQAQGTESFICELLWLLLYKCSVLGKKCNGEGKKQLPTSTYISGIVL